MNLTPLEPWIAHKIGRPSLLRAELEAYQLRRLQETLRLARSRSGFYRRHPAGTPAELGSLADLEQLPFTTAADLRANPLQFVCVSQDAIRRVVTLDTSGTSGAPKRLYFTREDQDLTLDFFRVGMSTFTAPGDRVLILLPGERPGSVGHLLAAALRDLGAVPIPHGPGRPAQETLAVLAGAPGTVLVGLPLQAFKLARAAADGPAVRLKSALLTADHVPEAVRRAVEQAFGGAVYNHYGMTEMGLGGGVDCAARRGYHLREADLYFEVVDPASGQPLPPGAEGELVFTTLTRAGMPLIRYRTGDLARWLPGPCPCGTCLKTLAHIATRLDGRLPLAGPTGPATLTMADLDEALFAIEGLVDFAATLRLAAADRLAELSVRVQAQAGDFDEHVLAAAVAAALRSLPALAAGSVGLQVQVTRQPLAATGAAKRAIKIV